MHSGGIGTRSIVFFPFFLLLPFKVLNQLGFYRFTMAGYMFTEQLINSVPYPHGFIVVLQSLSFSKPGKNEYVVSRGGL